MNLPLTPLVETGAPAKLTQEPQRRCPYCNVRLEPPFKTACGADLCKKKRRMAKDALRKREDRTAPRGRQCSDCLAYDHETTFSHETHCEACTVQAQRHGRCDNCKAPLGTNREKGGDPTCPRCEPPLYAIEVLWTAADGRMRRVFRAIKDGKVFLAGKGWLVKSNPMRLVVPVSKWVPVRR